MDDANATTAVVPKLVATAELVLCNRERARKGMAVEVVRAGARTQAAHRRRVASCRWAERHIAGTAARRTCCASATATAAERVVERRNGRERRGKVRQREAPARVDEIERVGPCAARASQHGWRRVPRRIAHVLVVVVVRRIASGGIARARRDARGRRAVREREGDLRTRTEAGWTAA